MSKDGIDLSELQFHSVAIIEKAKEIKAEDLLKQIEDENNSENLKIICVQALDFLAKENKNFKLKDTSRLETILLNEKQDSIVRQNIVWAMSTDKRTYDILESLVFEDDEYLAFQALKRLNSDAPERASDIAYKLIETEEQNEKLRIAIKVISEQFAQSDDIKEKDEWIAYCMDVFEKSSASKNDLMQETIVFALSDMFYSKALYEIINNDQIDNSLKVSSIGQNYKVIIDVLEKEPSKNDIEMAIKAMTIYPIDKTVDALKSAVSKSGEKYNFKYVISQAPEPALEKWNDKVNGK